jgi:hypothetical protein
MTPLKQLEAFGQSPWLNYLKRSLIEKGELRDLIEREPALGYLLRKALQPINIGQLLLQASNSRMSMRDWRSSPAQ